MLVCIFIKTSRLLSIQVFKLCKQYNDQTQNAVSQIEVCTVCIYVPFSRGMGSVCTLVYVSY